MKDPNYEETVGKHPIPHAKDIAKSDKKQDKKITEYDKKGSKEEE
ncbi:hypothetical protein [Psychroserpens sp. Hel_I_66]|nr:hypothetical protein [Psychroserpens sp. Hel_I_66]